MQNLACFLKAAEGGAEFELPVHILLSCPALVDPGEVGDGEEGGWPLCPRRQKSLRQAVKAESNTPGVGTLTASWRGW